MGLLPGIPEIDEKASRQQARELLSKYRRYSRMAGVRLTDIQSPTIDGMPMSSSYENRAEAKIVNHIDAETIVHNCQQAMQLLSTTSYWIIYYSFMCEPKLTYYQISTKMVGYSEESIDYLKRKGLLEFAEAYPDGKLLIYKSEFSDL